MPTVTIGRHTAELVAPSPLAVIASARTQAELDAAGPALSLALMTAILRLSWPDSVTWPAPLRPPPWRVGMRLEQYGHDAYDGLIRAGVSLAELLTAARMAYQSAHGETVTSEEISAARDFSDPHAGG